MRRLDSYIVREMLVPFLIGTVAVVLMFQANMLIALFKNLRLGDVPFAAVLQVVLFKTPSFLNMTLPVGMALASSLAVSRLARESELTAMRSAGVPILRVVVPVMVVGALVAVGNFFLVEKLMPSGERAARKLSNEIGLLALNPQIKSNVVVNLRTFTATFGLVTRGQAGTINLSDILLIERRSQGETLLITAERGTYLNGLWRFERPYARLLRGEDLLSAKTEKTLEIKEPISVPDFFLSPEPEEQTYQDLARAIEQAKKTKRDTSWLEVAYHVKFSVPAACLVFALTGPVFAIWLARSGPFVGVLLSIVLVLIYYNAFVISTEIFGRYGWLSPPVAAWLPNVLLFGLGLLALRRAE